ncbi:signal recognition particle-docking protein FtsY [Nitratireductor alexandrii]|uniref:signal recognition particle-docking protein FtsY n=1 Tax=Nitratireductor alexandrii TaxID=2448161 RepID=UPI000FDA43DF|nr:signal recognition particle-docking protein FtsY [Nitratireductor alexandrii]
MAFGFIKKVFSFGRKKVEDRDEDGAPLPETAPPDDAGIATQDAAVTPAGTTESRAPAAPEPTHEEPVRPEPADEAGTAHRRDDGPEARPSDIERITARTSDQDGEKPDAPSSALEHPDAKRAAPRAPQTPEDELAEETVEAEPLPPTTADDTSDTRETTAPSQSDGSEPIAPQPATTAPARPTASTKQADRPVTPSEPEPAAAAPEATTPPEPVKPDIAPDASPGQPEPTQTEPDADQPAAPQSPPSPKPAAPAGKVTVAKSVEAKRADEPAAPEATARQSWFQRLRQGLARSSRELTGNIAGVFTKRKLDEDALQDLEDVLIQADLGMETAIRITDTLASGRYGRDVSEEEVRAVMASEIENVLAPVALPLELDLSHKPHVVLVVGVNGTGKTTTIGKLAAKLTAGGLDVMLAAGDTFRAAAIEQLKIWGERTHSPVVASRLGADAAGLAYEAFEKAKEAGSDVLIIDTAGRLQNKAELMAELEKIVRVLGKLDPEAPHTVLQTVDATTGQNALNQVEIFRNIAGVNGLVMTKLDGTARGGILVGIAAKHKLPVYFIGVGEQVDDLEPFSAGDFAKAIAGVA